MRRANGKIKLTLFVVMMAIFSMACAEEDGRGVLKFRLYTGLELGSKSTINPRCFSNVITVANVAMERDDQLTAEVRSIIESRFDEFLGKCAAMADGVLRGKPALGGPYYEIGSRADNFPVDTRPENAFVNMR